jgi:hypothetical protein
MKLNETKSFPEKPTLDLIGRIVWCAWDQTLGKVVGILSDNRTRIKWPNGENEIVAHIWIRLVNENIPICSSCFSRDDIYPSVFGYTCRECHIEKLNQKQG